MTTRCQRRTALREAVLLAVALLAVLSAVALVKQQPATQDELQISASTLRSQAAELELLLSQDGDPAPPRYVRAQATQLAKAIDKSRDELDGLKLQAALEPRRRELQPLLAELQATVRGLQGAHMPATAASTAATHRVRQALQAIEKSLQ